MTNYTMESLWPRVNCLLKLFSYRSDSGVAVQQTDLTASVISFYFEDQPVYDKNVNCNSIELTNILLRRSWHPELLGEQLFL